MDSLTKFFDRFKEINNLKEMINDLNPPMNPESRDKMRVLTRAAIVMLCSHIEGYLEDTVIEFVDKICENTIPMRKVPGELKVAHMKESLKKIKYEKNSIKKLFTDYGKLWINEQILEKNDIDGERIISNFSIPGSGRVEELLEGIGCAKIWEQIPDSEKSGRLKYILDSLVQRRNQIAHGDLKAVVALDDVIRYTNSALEFAGQINVIIEQYLTQILNN